MIDMDIDGKTLHMHFVKCKRSISPNDIQILNKYPINTITCRNIWNVQNYIALMSTIYFEYM